MENRLILREVRKAYEVPSRCLRDHLGFEIMDILPRDETPIQSKGAWLKQGIRASARLLGRLGRVRKADQVLLIGNYMSLFAVLLNKLHVIRPRRLFWWGLQIRGEKMQKLLKIAFKVCDAPNLRFIIFSRYEKELYVCRMGLREESLLSLPYGDWINRPEEARTEDQAADYYFSGGYSNRDYAGLIRAWEKIDRKLVIIGSKHNADLLAYTQHPTNPNVEVLLDTPPDVFSRCLGKAKAVILPFKSDSGAAGQTVALQCMKRGIVLISSRISAMVEYTDDGRTGFLLRNMEEELAGAVEKIEAHPEICRRMIAEQKQLFDSTFAYDVIIQKLLALFDD